jgi:AcrR family transcriptional regulator
VVIKRGTGREALIEAAAAVLARGDDVQIKDVAASVGVSHTLIYRHFPRGGKEELVAEAHARLFRGVASDDFEFFFTLFSEGNITRDQLRDFYVTLLDPERENGRWSRLQALVQARSNPFLTELIDASRQRLINDFAERLMRLMPKIGHESAVSISLLSQAIPLGLMAIAGADITEEQRLSLAEHWADAMLVFLPLR